MRMVGSLRFSEIERIFRRFFLSSVYECCLEKVTNRMTLMFNFILLKSSRIYHIRSQGANMNIKEESEKNQQTFIENDEIVNRVKNADGFAIFLYILYYLGYIFRHRALYMAANTISQIICLHFVRMLLVFYLFSSLLLICLFIHLVLFSLLHRFCWFVYFVCSFTQMKCFILWKTTNDE